MEAAWKRALVQFLAAFWRRADWKKIARNQNAWDIFGHRVQVASTQPNFRRVCEKLCATLSSNIPQFQCTSLTNLTAIPKPLMICARRFATG